MLIPNEHQLKCNGCGQILDMRDPAALAHGWIQNGEIVCDLGLEPLLHSYSGTNDEPVLNGLKTYLDRLPIDFSLS